MPVWPRATWAVIWANPSRSASPEPEIPRSSSMTWTWWGCHPISTARSASRYCLSVDSRLRSTCVVLDWRT